MTTATDSIHKFERAGLGQAPFRVVGFEIKTYQAHPGAPVQVGAACDYCGTGIKETFYIEGADGKRFKVGNQCVHKTGDRGLIRVVDAQIRKLRAAKRKERELAKALELVEVLQDESIRKVLATIPHPNTYMAEQRGLTFLDWAEWTRDRAGNSAKAKALGAVKARAERGY